MATNVEEKQISKEKKAEIRAQSRGHEILRFIIVGVICTIIDFAVSYLLRFAFANNLNAINDSGAYVHEVGHYIATAICVASGFIVSVIVNWFLSKGWVFQNVDKNKNYSKARYFWLYVLLSFCGFALGIGIMLLGEWIVSSAWNIQYPRNPFDENIWGNLFSRGGWPFWAYVIIFIIKTLLVLIFNYLTRKYIIFKEPKKQPSSIAEEATHPAVIYDYDANAATTEVKKKEKAVTEVETVYCKPQFNWGRPISKASAKRQIYSSLEIYDPRKTSVGSTKRNKEIIVEEIQKADRERKK